MRRFARVLPRLLPVILGSFFLSACAEVSAPLFQVVPGVREIDLRWQPKAGMRVVHQIATRISISGPLAQNLPESQRNLARSQTRIMDITSVTSEYFEFRDTEGGVAIPATMRFSRDWVPVEIRFDDPRMLTEKDHIAVKAVLSSLEQVFRESAQFFRPWRIGETRPFEIRLPGPQGSASVKGTATFRRVVLIHDRPSAEFDGVGSADLTVEETTMRMTLPMQWWMDLATGVSLKSKSKGTIEFSMKGQSARMDLETEEVLDFGSSRGL